MRYGGIIFAAIGLTCWPQVVFGSVDISQLISAAKAGDTVLVPTGVYRGEIRIDKPLKLIGVGRPTLDGGGNGDIITITAPDVEIRGFRICGTGIDLDKENCAIRVNAARVTIVDNILDDVLFGIDLKESPDSVIRGNHIGGKVLDVARRGDGLRLWRADRTIVEDNEIHNGRDAILWYSTDVIVRSNKSHDGRYGFHLMFSNGVTIEKNDLFDNSVGVYLMYSSKLKLIGNRMLRNRGPSGYGLGLKETDDFLVQGNIFVGNCVGIYIDGSPFATPDSGRITENTISANDTGVEFLPAVKGNHLWSNSFVDNFEQIAILGRGELTGNEFDRDERGNFWSDYPGYDRDGDGVGEANYESRLLFENLTAREPSLRLFMFSPIHQAVEFIARAVPAVRPEPKFTDYYPLIEPPIEHGAELGSSTSLVMVALSAGLLSIATAVLGIVFFSPIRDAMRERRFIAVI
ncbi:MAG: nitrous oxide reductase family maturation protein NosD [Phycisphaerales bacterium]|jgi:nitrous oxidase accessory protein